MYIKYVGAGPYRSISRWVVFTEIFKALKSVNTHNNIQTLTFTNNT